jgi:hypothetical protein
VKTTGRRSAVLGQARSRAIRSGVTGCRSPTSLIWPCIIIGAEQLRCIWSGTARHQSQVLGAIHLNSLWHQRAMKSGDGVGFWLRAALRRWPDGKSTGAMWGNLRANCPP